MILVNPEYLPSVNYFKLFKDNNIVLDYEGKYNNQSQLTRTWIFGNDKVFPLEIPIKSKSKNFPYEKTKAFGEIILTMVDGKIIFENGKLNI